MYVLSWYHLYSRLSSSFDDPKHPNMISRRHAKILKAVEGEKEVFQVEDLNSTNGILVNFLRVKTASLS